MKDYIQQVLKTQSRERSIVIHVLDSKQKNEKAVNQKRPETSKILWFFRREKDDNNGDLLYALLVVWKEMINRAQKCTMRT